MQITEIFYPMPPGLNEQIDAARAHWRTGAAMKKEWTKKCLIRSKALSPMPDKVWLSFLWIIKNRGRDWDNTSAAAKFILDGLVEGGILKKDSMMVIQEPYIHFMRKPEGDEVEGAILTISSAPIYQIIPITY